MPRQLRTTTDSVQGSVSRFARTPFRPSCHSVRLPAQIFSTGLISHGTPERPRLVTPSVPRVLTGRVRRRLPRDVLGPGPAIAVLRYSGNGLSCGSQKSLRLRPERAFRQPSLDVLPQQADDGEARPGFWGKGKRRRAVWARRAAGAGRKSRLHGSLRPSGWSALNRSESLAATWCRRLVRTAVDREPGALCDPAMIP